MSWPGTKDLRSSQRQHVARWHYLTRHQPATYRVLGRLLYHSHRRQQQRE